MKRYFAYYVDIHVFLYIKVTMIDFIDIFMSRTYLLYPLTYVFDILYLGAPSREAALSAME